MGEPAPASRAAKCMAGRTPTGATVNKPVRPIVPRVAT
jgi:hypothetical protein